MCIAWPMLVTELLPGEYAMAECDGVRRRISLRLLPEVRVGSYVLVHAGYAIEQLDREAAHEQTALMAELVSGMRPQGPGAGEKA